MLANTEVLHEKINMLSSRVRQLEDALEHSHSKFSTDPHPLLTLELRALKKPLEKGNEADLLAALRTGALATNMNINDGDSVDTNEVIDAIGSLSMAQPGRINFHGPSANAFYLLKNEDDDEEEEEEEEVDDSLPDYVPWLSYSFPFSPNVTHVAQSIRMHILNCLPEPSEAKRLSDFYFQHAAWMYTPITESEYRNDIFPLFYGHNMPASEDPLESHKLAILFLVFAMGTLLDLRSQEILTQEATRYYQIGRAALTLNGFLEARSIPAIQALLLMCHFMFLANIENSRWVIMGIVVKLAQSVGLHRDGTRFELSAEDTQKRRSLMWEIYTYDSWQSLTFGRPTSFALSSIDCEMAHETTHNEQGDVEMSFAAWKHRFSAQCLSIVHDQAFGARTPNYKVIQELDKKVRGFYIPPSLQVPGFSGKSSTSPLSTSSGEIERPSLQLTMQRYIAWSIKEITIFYMHRGYFARSVEDNKDDPLGGKYGSSVLAAHGSACFFINLIKSLHSQHPGMAERMWFLFTHVFSCSIVLGSIVTKCPGIPLSPSAYTNLDSAYLLFESVNHHPRAAKVLPVLKRLRERAYSSMNEYQSKKSLLPRLNVENSHLREEEDELLTLGGKTRLVSQKSSSTPSSRSGTDSLPSSSPRENNSVISAHTNSPPMTNIATINSPLDSPMSAWQSTWGPLSQQNAAYSYSSFPVASNQFINTSPTNWYNEAGPPQPSQPQYHRHSQSIPNQPQQQEPAMMMMNMDTAPIEHNMYTSQGSSSLSEAIVPYEYYQQRPSPPSSYTNDAQAPWHQLYSHALEGYS